MNIEKESKYVDQSVLSGKARLGHFILQKLFPFSDKGKPDVKYKTAKTWLEKNYDLLILFSFLILLSVFSFIYYHLFKILMTYHIPKHHDKSINDFVIYFTSGLVGFGCASFLNEYLMPIALKEIYRDHVYYKSKIGNFNSVKANKVIGLFLIVVSFLLTILFHVL